MIRGERLKFKRYEYMIKGEIEWCEEDMNNPEKDDFEEFKKKIDDEGFFDNLFDMSAKDIVEHRKNKDDTIILRVVEGYYDGDGNEVITNVDDRKVEL